jgi:hypothetical protein
MWLALQDLFGDSSISDDGKFKKDDHKAVAHEGVEHNHNLVIMEDCFTS